MSRGITRSQFDYFLELFDGLFVLLRKVILNRDV